MSNEIEDQLALYCDWIEQRSGLNLANSAKGTDASVVQTPTQELGSPRRRWTLALSAGLLIALSLTGLVTLTNHRADPATSPNADTARYEARGVVLESASHGPEICLSGALFSSPPQCKGIPLSDFDWAKIAAHSAGGARWSDTVNVVGTYGDGVFTVAEVTSTGADDVPGVQTLPPEANSVCAEPAGGWTGSASDSPGETSSADSLAAVARYTSSQADSTAFWTAPLQKSGIAPDDSDERRQSSTDDVGQSVLVATFTGDLDRHTADLHQVWPGPVCVGRSIRTLTELDQIRSDVLDVLGRADINTEIVEARVDAPNDVVVLTVTIDDIELTSVIAAQFGTSAVRVIAALKPV